MTPSEFDNVLNKNGLKLTAQQYEAMKTIDGPVLLLAVPGSGKTTVLVNRLGYMIYVCGIAPEQILTVTYTVAATRDMTLRFGNFFGSELENRLEFRTINGICAKILMRYGQLTGKKPFDLMTDEKRLSKIIADIYTAKLNERPTETDIKTVRTWITYVKNMMMNKQEIEKYAGEESWLVEIYDSYCQALKSMHLIDYDDQMVYAYKLLNLCPELLSEYQERYKYICVDEAQDTSKVQHMIIALLASKYQNIFMVGDEDQSIYGFRAAYPQALVDFDKNYPDARVLLMEENFRSNAIIVNAADSFIQKNLERHPKKMHPSRPSGEPIHEIQLKSRRSQYTYLGKVAENCTKNTAVLYRDNEMIIPLIDHFLRNNIAFKLKRSDMTFFSNRVVQDIINIINFAYEPDNADLFMQIYYKISLYMKRNYAEEACKISGEQGIDILVAAEQVPGVVGKSIANCRSMATHLKNMKSGNGEKAVNRIVNFMGYGEYLERLGLSDTKVYILQVLGSNVESPIELVNRLKGLENIIREWDNSKSCNFTLSTIHSSKGLEYDNVYLLDVKDELFPEKPIKNMSKASKEEKAYYEEERRLFYVGVTRAKNILNIFTFGNNSSFSNELLGKNTSKANITSAKNTYEISLFTEKFPNGSKITHKIFGEGTVMNIEGSRVNVAFKNGKKLLDISILLNNNLIK